jgi:hypothetical protein
VSPRSPTSIKGQEALSNDTEKLGKELEVKMVPTTLAGINEVNSLLDKLELKKGVRGGIQGDVPGFGTVAGMLPKWALSQEGKDLRSAAKSVSNKLLQAQSGLAVTDQENRRFLDQLQQGVFMNDTDFVTGWNRVLNEVQGRLDNFKGAYHPEVIGEYSKRNPGMKFSVPRPKILGGGAGGGAVPTAAPEQEGNPADKFFGG